MAASNLFNEDLQKINRSRRYPSNVSNYLFTSLRRRPVSDCMIVTSSLGSHMQREVVIGLGKQPCGLNLMSSSIGIQPVHSNQIMMLTKLGRQLLEAPNCMGTSDQLKVTQRLTPKEAEANGSGKESSIGSERQPYLNQEKGQRLISEYFSKEPKNMKMGSFVSKEKVVTESESKPEFRADSHKHLQNEGLARLSRMLGEMIKKAKDELAEIACKQANLKALDKVHVAVPLSYHVSECPNYKPLLKKRRVKTTSVAKLFTSFKIPEEFSACMLSLEKQLMSQTRSQPENQKLRRFPFLQRLECWVLECRQRIGGKYDTYFFHEKSATTFRSNVEVMEFLLYNAYPRSKTSSPKKRQPEEIAGAERRFKSRRKTPSFCKEKAFPTFSRNDESQEVLTEDDVVTFLRDSYNNLQNSCGNVSVQGSDYNCDSEATGENLVCDADDNFREEVEEESSPISSTNSVNCNPKIKDPGNSLVERSDVIIKEGDDIPCPEAEKDPTSGEMDTIFDRGNFWDFAAKDTYGHSGDLECTPSDVSALEVLSNRFNVA